MGGISVMLLMGMLSAMYVFFIAVIAVLIIYFAVSYVFESIAAMGMCKNLYYKHSGTAWIPFYNKYHGPLVKRLRHRPFTAVTRVRFPYGSLFWLLYKKNKLSLGS